MYRLTNSQITKWRREYNVLLRSKLTRTINTIRMSTLMQILRLVETGLVSLLNQFWEKFRTNRLYIIIALWRSDVRITRKWTHTTTHNRFPQIFPPNYSMIENAKAVSTTLIILFMNLKMCTKVQWTNNASTIYHQIHLYKITGNRFKIAISTAPSIWHLQWKGSVYERWVLIQKCSVWLAFYKGYRKAAISARRPNASFQ